MAAWPRNETRRQLLQQAPAPAPVTPALSGCASPCFDTQPRNADPCRGKRRWPSRKRSPSPGRRSAHRRRQAAVRQHRLSCAEDLSPSQDRCLGLRIPTALHCCRSHRTGLARSCRRRRWSRMPAFWKACLRISASRARSSMSAPVPVVTLYEFEPAPGVKSSRGIGLADDIARSMSALSARVAGGPWPQCHRHRTAERAARNRLFPRDDREPAISRRAAASWRSASARRSAASR